MINKAALASQKKAKKKAKEKLFSFFPPPFRLNLFFREDFFVFRSSFRAFPAAAAVVNTLFCSSFSTRATNITLVFSLFCNKKEKSFFSPQYFLIFKPEVGSVYVENVRALLRRVSRVRERERKKKDDDDDDELLFDNDDDDDENDDERFVDDEA